MQSEQRLGSGLQFVRPGAVQWGQKLALQQATPRATAGEERRDAETSAEIDGNHLIPDVKERAAKNRRRAPDDGANQTREQRGLDILTSL
jgi:hypothetical protein